MAPVPRQIWTRQELLAFLASTKTHRLDPFLHLAAFSGARRGEPLNRGWADVELDAAMIKIRGTAAVIAGTRVEGPTKGGREREVGLDRGTIKVLAAHRAKQGRDRLLAGPDWSSGDDVFTRALVSRCTPTPSRS